MKKYLISAASCQENNAVIVSSNSSGNSHIFDLNVRGGNFIAGENKITHRANFVTKIKFNINDLYKKQHRRRRDAQEKSRL